MNHRRTSRTFALIVFVGIACYFGVRAITIAYTEMRDKAVSAASMLVSDTEAASGDERPAESLKLKAPHSTKDSTLSVRVPCEIVRVLDGDTVVVRPTIAFKVRLLRCWVNDGTKEDEKAAQWLRTQVGKHASVMVTVPNGEIFRVQTFDRTLAEIESDGLNFSDYIVEVLKAGTHERPEGQKE